MKIMVVDDSRQIRRHVVRTLKACDYDCCEAEDGLVAINLLKTETDVDVILLDWNMPVMDGMETLEAVKKNPETHHIKVIMMTTENKAERVETAFEKGADEYIMKPLTKEVIIEKLETIDDDFL